MNKNADIRPMVQRASDVLDASRTALADLVAMRNAEFTAAQEEGRHCVKLIEDIQRELGIYLLYGLVREADQ